MISKGNEHYDWKPKYNQPSAGKHDKLRSDKKEVISAVTANKIDSVVYGVGTEKKGLDLLITILYPQISRMSIYSS